MTKLRASRFIKKAPNDYSIVFVVEGTSPEHEIAFDLPGKVASPKDWIDMGTKELRAAAPSLGLTEPLEISWPKGWV